MSSISRMKSLLSPTFSTSAPKLSKTPPLSPYFQKAVQSIRWNFRASETLSFLHVKPTMRSLNSSVSQNHTGIRTLQTEASQSPSGEIHVIVGPMFAGKTTTLLRRVKSESSAGRLQAKVPKNFVHLDETLKGLCFRGRLTEAIQILCCTGDQVYPETYSLLLQECIFEKEYMKGRRIHAQMITVGFAPNEYLKIKLLILYAKAGDLETAHIMFDKLLKKSLISWNAMIAGYVQKGLAEMGLSLYYKMRESGLTPDQYTFASVFRACSTLATLEQGKQAHGVMIKAQFSENVVVNSALMDMYFKCSNPCDGHLVFDKSLDRNVITWTSLISGYGQNGRVVEVLELFHRMINEGFRPNYVTFLVVLSACSHGGLVNEGWEYFLSMTRDYGILPRGKHYAAMVDLLGRAGKLDEAYEFARNSPCVEHSVVWGALLGACRIHGNMEMVKLAAKKFFELEPGNVGKYVVLCNAYAASGLWDSVAEVRRSMKESGMKKESGYSIIEVQREVHYFFMGNNSHKQTEQIYELIKDMIFILKDAGYVPDLNG